MQRVDDVTGQPIRLSATERERQREAMTERLTELTAANNALYARTVELETRADETELVLGMVKQHALMSRYVHPQTATFWQRLRWLVRGC